MTDRTAALEAALAHARHTVILATPPGKEPDFTLRASCGDGGLSYNDMARALLSTAKEADRMREALEITRMQLNVSAAGKIALSREKHLSIVEAALLPSEGKPQS